MLEVKNSELKNKIKKNVKFYFLVIFLCLIAWFGVKMIVSKSSATASATTSKQSNSLLQLGGTGAGGRPDSGGTPPAGGYIPYDGGTPPSGGAAAK